MSLREVIERPILPCETMSLPCETAKPGTALTHCVSTGEHPLVESDCDTSRDVLIGRLRKPGGAGCSHHSNSTRVERGESAFV